ncbi:substrate-binding domain-containing protein [Streptomyces aurantiacus]|uniref:VWA domain-containing protein n=1 Tax=Streptomyces aurantiacus TaxID=47760 RepID=A0A7G1P7K3_9ACTN|nr:VWA domain-containing protein [Streptomyces aurantiacus]BCL30992.1 VWA domain-containing protein [Streptomyces aurantiacus]
MRRRRGTLTPRPALPFTLALTLTFTLALTAACSGDDQDRTTLRVLAGPDLAVLEPLLDELRSETGVELDMDYRADADTGEALAATGKSGGGHELAWLSTDRSFRLSHKDTARGMLRTPTMLSPVVIGLRPDVARELRTDSKADRLSWADIADGAATGTVRFGMADPRQTGTGLAALVGVATAAAGTGGALREDDVSCDRLRGFRSGQRLTAASTRDLLDDFVDHPGTANALISYESDLLALNSGGRLTEKEKLEIVRPEDGTVLADFPLLLLDPDRRAAYDKVVEWLRRDSVQQKIMRTALRRPVNASVAREGQLRAPLGNALYFPDRQAVLKRLLDDYGDPRRRIGDQVIFLLDFSGSMRGARMAELRAAFADLSGADSSATGGFARFYQGERLTVVRFGGRVLEERTVTVRGQRDLTTLADVVARGGYGDATAVWTALDHGYRTASAAVADEPERAVSIVLMTDGENNAGLAYEEFVRRYEARPAETRTAVHTYPVHFGEADAGALRRAAAKTGGHMVDARDSSLSEAFKEIRGCR